MQETGVNYYEKIPLISSMELNSLKKFLNFA